MPLPAVPRNIARVSVTGTMGSQPWANVFHIKTTCSADPVASDVSDLAENLRGKYVEAFGPVFNENGTILECDISWSAGAGLSVDGLAVNSVVGSDSGAPLDCAAAVGVSWRVAESWRGGHPRQYLPCVTQDRLDTPSAYSTGTLSDYQDAVDEWLGFVNGITTSPFNTVTLGCLRIFSGGAALDPPQFVEFIAGVVRPTPFTQRRRLI